MTAPDPFTHKCTLGTVCYDLVDDGTIWCARDRGGCGRRWTFVKGRGWAPSPTPVAGRPRQVGDL